MFALALEQKLTEGFFSNRNVVFVDGEFKVLTTDELSDLNPPASSLPTSLYDVLQFGEGRVLEVAKLVGLEDEARQWLNEKD
jgi:hypothetical protein